TLLSRRNGPCHFFFQAEDGIRYGHVTGVQTCALPILRCDSFSSDLQFHHRTPAEKLSHRIWSWSEARIRAELAKCVLLCAVCHRSEERRVGKECSSRWSPNE